MACQICEKRKPRRYCPGIGGEICAPCCGNEREQTIDCPLDCEYLQDARRHERLPEVNPDEFPNADLQVTDSLIRANEHLLLYLSGALLQAALETPAVTDADLKECLDALVRTYRALESGIYYEIRPENALASAVYQRVRAAAQHYQTAIAQQRGVSAVRDADVLGVLVFLQRLEIQRNNGRRRGRAFIDFLRSYFAEFQAARPAGPPAGAPSGGANLIL